MKRKIFYILPFFFFSLIFFFSPTITFGQDVYEYGFTNYTIEDGLPSNSIFSVVQDSLGFLWIGTQQGVCRFDGRKFKVFQQNPNDTNSLSFNDAGNLFYDSQGKIWIGTWGEGADLFDPRTETFKHYKPEADNPNSLAGRRIQQIFEDSFGTLWFCSESNGLSRLDKKNRENGFFINYIYDENNPNSISSKRVRGVAEDRNGNLWFASDNGFFRLKKENREKGIFERFVLPKIKYGLPSPVVYSIFVSRENKLYLGTDYGIFIIEHPEKLEGKLKKGQFRHQMFSRRNFGLEFTTVFVIFEDHAGRIWLGTQGGGIILYGAGRKGFYRFSKKLFHKHSLPDNHIRSLFEDRTHNLWIGTLENGLAKLNLKNRGIHKLNTILADNSFIAETEDGTVYFGTNRGVGKLIFNNKGGIAEHSRVDLGKIEISFNVYTHGFYSEGKLYIYNPWLKFYEYDTKTKRVRPVTNLNECIENNPSSLIAAVKGVKRTETVWLAFEDGTILNYNMRTGKIHSYIVIASEEYDKLTTLFEDDDGNLWVGTANGLGFWKRNEKVLEFDLPLEIQLFQHDAANPRSLVADYVTSIAADNNGVLWIGTLNGLSKLTFHEKQALFTNFNRANSGLANNYIESIIASVNRRVWCGTAYGLSAFSKNSYYAMNFYETDGLPSNRFSSNSVCVTKDKKLIFGTSNGLIYFYPDSIKRNSFRPNVVISDIFLVDSERKLKISAPYLRELTLKPNENSFIINLAALEYTNPAVSRYVYFLKGFQKRWSKISYDNRVVFTNLPPGEYEFLYSASNNNNRWAKGKQKLKITVLPYFYNTRLFKLSVLAFTALVVIFIFYRHKRNIEVLRKEIESRKEVEKKLKESEEKYRELVESAIDAIIKIKPSGEIIGCNRAFVELTGLEHHEIVGKHYEHFFYKNDRKIARKEFKQCLSGIIARFEARVLIGKQSFEWFSIFLKPIYDEKGRIRYIHSISRNISYLKKAEEEIIKAKQKAEDAEKLKEWFLSQMSHEIRTPVHKVFQALNIIKYHDEYTQENVDFALRALEHGAERIHRSSDLILRMSDLLYGKYKVKKKRLNIVETAKGVFLKYKEKAERKGLKISFETTSEEIVLEYDPDAIGFVLDNIIDNAVKYTEKGEIVVRVFEENGKIGIAVTDTGIGIPEEKKVVIFNLFEQVSSGYRRKFDGVGLGLPVARGYCKANNCTMEFFLNEPVGTKVIIWLS